MVTGLIFVLIIVGLIIAVFGIVLCAVYERMGDLYDSYLVAINKITRIAVHMAAIEHDVAKLASEKEDER